MKTKSLILCILLTLCSNIVLSQKTYNLESPQKNINITISADGDILKYSVTHDNTPIITDSPISMELNDGKILGSNPIVRSYDIENVNETIKSVLYKKETIIDNYNELTLNFKGNYSIQFRAYDDGIAYRFITKFSKPIIVKKENITYNFDDDYTAYIPYVNPSKGHGDNISKQFFNSFENTYSITPISEIENDKLAFMPILISLKDNKKVVITEADLEDYPGTYLTKNINKKNSIVGLHANYPKVEEQGGYNNLQYIVKEREDYIAKVQGAREFPWRCMIISENDKELLNNDMVYKLASPSRIEDESWIVPGKVAWEWWNAWNIKGVDFESGINNETYKHYIDFASEYGIEYVILDEGWAVNKEADMFNVIPEIDIYELVDYADNKGVGIVLWAGYYAIERDMEEICKYYSELGVKGFKVDFIDRDDQKAVNFYYKMAETAAKYNLIIDFHGAYKPTGLNRTFPNVLNFEGVYGLENLKWNQNIDLVTYETTIPFIRMLAGPLDFTQGAMRNANRDNYRAVWTEPMSQGTRCRQLAEYVIFESPFNMLCDSPSNYRDEDECAKYITEIPTVWDETIALDGEVGEYVIIARRSGDRWYVGGITNWEDREIEIDLSSLNLKHNQATEFRDGVNANKIAEDYSKNIITIDNNTYMVKMSKGGGFVLIF
ncbi:MAG: glycoside hydrolase family 97 protein [Lentimicrobiaceae bacterium]|nr:glycoside hydrolase family 97 protein [Lentimicrobiaceae bacterium]